MSDEKLRQVRVLHLVSSGGVTAATQQSLFMPLLTRMPKQRVKMQVVSLVPGFVAAAVLRQHGMPVHDIPFSKRRFVLGAPQELLNTTRQFRPDVIQAWGHTAQLAALAVRARCDWQPKVVWCIAETAPLPKDAGLIDRRKLKMTAKSAGKTDRIVYASESAASAHRRVGYPLSHHMVIPPGVDPMRYKPDPAARKKVREQLGLAADAFVIGMVAPFQPEFDHATLIKGVGELLKTHPNAALILAGHGVQKGNAPLMALVGGGTLATRTHLLGEWSDIATFFAACDVACSSALNDSSRMSLVMAMLCGVPCVATGMGAQGEVLGKHGVAIEMGSPAAFVRGITRVMQMPPDRRNFMVQGARRHALEHFVSVRSLQKYLQMYFDVVGRETLAADDVPMPEIDESLPVAEAQVAQSAADTPTEQAAAQALQTLHQQMADPDSLEAKAPAVELGYRPPPPPAPRVQPAARTVSDGDVLKIFESSLQHSGDASDAAATAMNERARGVAEDIGELLPFEELQVPVGKSARDSSSRVNPPADIPLKTETPRPAQQPSPQLKAVNIAAAAEETKTPEPAPAKIARAKPAVRPAGPRSTPVQLPMLPQDISYDQAAATPAKSTLQLDLSPHPEEENTPAAASG